MRLRLVNLKAFWTNRCFWSRLLINFICIFINVAITMHSTRTTRVKDPQKSHKVTSLGPASQAQKTIEGPAEYPPRTHRGPEDDSQSSAGLPRTYKRPAKDPHRCLLSEVNNFKICRTVHISNCRHRPRPPRIDTGASSRSLLLFSPTSKSLYTE